MNRPQQDRSEDDVIEAEVEIALLDIEGTIVWVNNAWHEFARANGGDTERVGIGTSYLKACDGDTGNAAASQVASAIRSALAGDLPAPLTIRIPCDGPDQARWFDVLISSRADAAGALVGATVTLSP